MKQFIALFGILFITGILAGCGGGAGTETGSSQQQASTAIIFSVTSSARLPIRVNYMKITANLPPEVTCTASPTGKLNVWEIAPASVNYSVLPKQITFIVSDASQTQAGSQMGEFARLVCSTSPGVTVSTSSFTGINSPFPYFKAMGYDGANSVDLYDPANQYMKRYVTPTVVVQ